jgi:hypothetical protein
MTDDIYDDFKFWQENLNMILWIRQGNLHKIKKGTFNNCMLSVA